MRVRACTFGVNLRRGEEETTGLDAIGFPRRQIWHVYGVTVYTGINCLMLEKLFMVLIGSGGSLRANVGEAGVRRVRKRSPQIMRVDVGRRGAKG